MNPEAEKTLREGRQWLEDAIRQERYKVQAAVRFVPALRKGNDIVLDDGTVFPMLRSQSKASHYRCLADYFDTEQPRPLGLFTIVAQPVQPAADESARLMDHALCARLAEAAAEQLQQQAYGSQSSPAACHCVSCGGSSVIRVAFGYPTCPDHSLKRLVFDCLQAEQQLGVTLTENYSILPSTSICGLFISHPEARYFSVGRIGEDQLADYCRRRGISLEEGEQLLSKYIVKQ